MRVRFRRNQLCIDAHDIVQSAYAALDNVTHPEFLANAPDEQLGTADGRCILIDPANLKFDCSITSHISNGQPLPAGDLVLAGTLTLVQGTTSTFALIGGTGPYRTARGDVNVELGPFQGPHAVTINLILNP